MHKLSMPIRAVLYREEDRWIAHCLEFDLIGDGDDLHEALESLSQAIVIQLEETVSSGNLDNLFSPADRRFFQMFAAGRHVAEGDLTLEFQRDGIEIEEMETREYCGDLALA